MYIHSQKTVKMVNIHNMLIIKLQLQVYTFIHTHGMNPPRVCMHVHVYRYGWHIYHSLIFIGEFLYTCVHSNIKGVDNMHVQICWAGVCMCVRGSRTCLRVTRSLRTICGTKNPTRCYRACFLALALDSTAYGALKEPATCRGNVCMNTYIQMRMLVLSTYRHACRLAGISGMQTYVDNWIVRRHNMHTYTSTHPHTRHCLQKCPAV